MAGRKNNRVLVILIIIFIVLVTAFAFVFVKCSFTDNAAREETVQTEATGTTEDQHDAEVRKRNSRYHVLIEAGHGIDENGAWDAGCAWNGMDEAELMVPIAKATAEALEGSGVTVYTDAYTDNDSNLNFALDRISSDEINVFVNIHCDYEGAESGTMPLYNSDEQKKLATCLDKGVHEYVEIGDRGLQWRDDLETLCNEKVTSSTCTSCLFETGCISKDYEVLSTQYEAYGRGLAKGICDYLGIEFIVE